jgi:hypothetical protein
MTNALNALKKNIPIFGKAKNYNKFKRCCRGSASGPCTGCTECTETPIPFNPPQTNFLGRGYKKSRPVLLRMGFQCIQCIQCTAAAQNRQIQPQPRPHRSPKGDGGQGCQGCQGCCRRCHHCPTTSNRFCRNCPSRARRGPIPTLDHHQELDQLMSINKLTTTWPAGCQHPASCERHGACMYIGCIFSGKDIAPMLRALWKPWNGKDSRGYDMKKKGHSRK